MVTGVRAREVVRKEKRGRIGETFQHVAKCPSHTCCPKCHLIFLNGVWKRTTSRNSGSNYWKLCPACVQIRGGLAGGVAQFTGTYAISHRQDLLNRIHNVEKQVLRERPLERIIDIVEDRRGIAVSATTEHLIARIGKAIERDFGGNLELKYALEDKLAFAHWHRDM
jgi:hypothetical protein